MREPPARAARWPWLLSTAVLLACTMPLQTLSVARRPARGLPAVLYLQSPAVARRVVLSFDALAADFYWMRALQHFGGTRLGRFGAKRYENLHPFLDLATSLDPRFTVAYRFGAIFLSEAPPGGPGKPDLAVRLLEKGLRATPERWQYYQDIGFVHYWWTGDTKQAADAFSRGAAIAGAPWWMKSLAAVTYAQGGDRQTSRFIFRALAQSTEIEWLRQDAQRRLKQLDALDQIDALDAKVDRAKAAGAGAPWSWLTLFEHGLLTTPPFDPAGTPYVIDMTTGRVMLSPRSRLWPLPSEPKTLAPLEAK